MSKSNKFQKNVDPIDNYMHSCCEVASLVKQNEDFDIQIINGVGEVEINGVEYQVQVVLEPKKKNWVDPHILPTARQTPEIHDLDY